MLKAENPLRLTVHSDYALRLLIHVAAKAPQRSTVGEVATAYGISRSHLMKIVQHLGAAGILQNIRGKGGGIYLAHDPAQIRVGDVVRHAEPDMALLPCFSPVEDACVISDRCRLVGIMNQALGAFMAVLDGHTVADLIRPKAPLRALLGIEAGAAQNSRATSAAPRGFVTIVPVRGAPVVQPGRKPLATSSTPPGAVAGRPVRQPGLFVTGSSAPARPRRSRTT